MLKVIGIIITSLILSATAFAQPIELQKTHGKYNYTQAGKILTPKKVLLQMSPNSEAFELMRKARSNKTFSQVLGGVGGFIVGYQLGGLLSGQEISGPVFAIGLGLGIISIPINSGAIKKGKQALELHNNSLENVSYIKHNPQFKITVNNGLGIAMTF